ncbi:hypothetical protein ACWCQO_39445, partial [Streptomyces microflavus]
MSQTTYIVGRADTLFTIELEPEVRHWLETLPAKHFLKVDVLVDHRDARPPRPARSAPVVTGVPFLAPPITALPRV